MSPARVELQLPGTRRAPGLARRAVVAHLRDVVSEDDLRTLTLLVSELVTNAIRHAGEGEAPVGLVVDAAGACIRVEVHDRGPGFEPSALGCGRGNGGSQVWFELDRRAA